MIHTPFPDFLQVRVRLELCTTGVFVSLDISLSPQVVLSSPRFMQMTQFHVDSRSVAAF